MAGRPSFIKTMESCRVFEKERAKFEVEFDGNPRPSIQWFREDQPISNSADMQVHTVGAKSTLIIREASIKHSGKYAAAIANSGGGAKCFASLVVEDKSKSLVGKVPPDFTKALEGMVKNAGSTIKLEVKLSGTPPIEILWNKDGRRVNEDSRHKILIEGATFILIITDTTIADSGNYECVANNLVGGIRCSAQVKII